MDLAKLNTILVTIRSRLGLNQLTVRERLTLLGAGLLIVILLVYQIIISPYLDARRRVLNSIDTKKAELTEIVQLKQQYEALRVEEGGIKANLAKRSRGFTLFTFLDQQAEKADIKAKIKYMKPSMIPGDENTFDESIVEMKLEGIPLERLVEFLQLTESKQNVVSVRRMSIQVSARAEGYLDVILQYVTLVEA